MTNVRSLSALTLLAAAALPAQAIRYAPVEAKYSVVTAIKRSDVRGDQKQDYTVTASQAMSLLLTARGADSLRFRLTLDSYSLASDLPIQLPNVGLMKGTVVEGVMTTAGRMLHYTHRSPVTSGADLIAVADNMSRFLVTVAPGATYGSSTTDTTSSHRANDGGDLDERTIATTMVDGDTVFAGQKAWRIRRSTVITVAGSTVQGGQTLRIAGGGTGSGVFYLSTKGVYLGAVTRSATNTTITLPDGSTVASAQDATSTISQLK